MARTQQQIQAALVADFQAQPELAAANSTSNRAIWRLFLFVVSGGLLLLEQIIDIFRAETETKIAAAIPNTKAWLTAKVLEFQYDDTNPQILYLDNYAPKYPTVAPQLRIVTRCSVVSTIANRVVVKVAKNNPPEALDSTQISSLQDYVNTIGTAGISYTVTSGAADKIYIDADIYYNGQYSSVIQASVIAAINNYLVSLPFNGILKISDIEIAIRNVEGVSDCLINNLKLRDDATAFDDGTFLVQNKTVISRLFPTIAGYVVGEDTSGQTLSDSLNFVSYV